jgi:hypothetical protein
MPRHSSHRIPPLHPIPKPSEARSQDIHAHHARQEDLALHIEDFVLHIEDLVTELNQQQETWECAQTANKDFDGVLRREGRAMEGTESALDDLSRTRAV